MRFAESHAILYSWAFRQERETENIMLSFGFMKLCFSFRIGQMIIDLGFDAQTKTCPVENVIASEFLYTFVLN